MGDQLAEIVDDASFHLRVLARPRPTLTLFTGRGCLPCAVLEHRLPHIVDRLELPIDIALCPVELCPETARRYSIARTPSALVFIEGGLAGAWSGPVQLPTVEHWLLTLLSARGATDHEPTGSRTRGSWCDAIIRQLPGRTRTGIALGIAAVAAPILLVANDPAAFRSGLFSLPLARTLGLNFLVSFVLSSRPPEPRSSCPRIP